MADLRTEIVEIEEALAEAFNRRDLSKVLSVFDGEMIGFSSTTHDRIEGLDRLRETFEHYLEEGESVEYTISDVRVQPFGDVAIASLHWVVNLRTGSHSHAIPGRGTHVFQKEKDEWRIVHEHFSRAHNHNAE
jgi:ketosteroid isomerase-like protein